MNGVEAEQKREIESIKEHFGSEIEEIGVDEWCEYLRGLGVERLAIGIFESEDKNEKSEEKAEKSEVSLEYIKELYELSKNGGIIDFFRGARFWVWQGIKVAKKYTVEKEGRLPFYGIDIDEGIEKVNEIVKNLPRPTFLIMSGRGWWVVYALEDGYYKEGERDDFRELKERFLKLIDDEKVKKENSHLKIKNFMLRPVGGINLKAGKVVKWYKLGEKWRVQDLIADLDRRISERISIEIVEQGKEQAVSTDNEQVLSTTQKEAVSINKEQISYDFSYCGLAKFLLENYMSVEGERPALRYHGWRLLALFAKKFPTFESVFYRLSKEWERRFPKYVQQTTEQRLKIAEREIKEREGFWACRTLVEKSVDELRELFHLGLDFHPCQSCKYKHSKRRPVEIQSFLLPSDYKEEGGELYKGERKIALNFHLSRIEKIIEAKDYSNLWIEVRDDDGESISLSLRDKETIEQYFRVLVDWRVFKNFLMEFIKKNEDIKHIQPTKTGYVDGKWWIFNYNYFIPVCSNSLDLQCKGDFKKWLEKWKEINDFVIEKKDIWMVMGVGNGLRFLKMDYSGFVPAVYFTGDAGVGKSLRLMLINTLIRAPIKFDADKLSKAFLENNSGKICGFLTIDEFRTTGKDDERTQVLMGLLNQVEKLTERGKYPPNVSPLLLAGEETSFQYWGRQGASRRVLKMRVEKDDEAIRTYNEALKELSQNFGFLFKISEQILEKEKEIREKIRNGEIRLNIQVEDKDNAEIIEKAIILYSAFVLAIYETYEKIRSGENRLNIDKKIYDAIVEFAEIISSTQKEAKELTIQDIIRNIREILFEEFEVKKKQSVFLDNILKKLPSDITRYRKVLEILFVDKWGVNAVSSKGKRYFYLRNCEIFPINPLYLTMKNVKKLSIWDFMKYIREKRKRMEEQCGEDYWKDIPDERIEQIVSDFFEGGETYIFD